MRTRTQVGNSIICLGSEVVDTLVCRELRVSGHCKTLPERVCEGVEERELQCSRASIHTFGMIFASICVT